MELYRDRRRKLSVNQVPAKNSAALSQVYHTVFFCPEDLYLIREGAAARRKFMDTALCQLRPRYAAALAEYNRLYEHKTRILRDSEERPDLAGSALPDFNERMVRFGAVLIHYRAQFAQALDGVCRPPSPGVLRRKGDSWRSPTRRSPPSRTRRRTWRS